MELEEFREKWKAELGQNKNSIKGKPHHYYLSLATSGSLPLFLVEIFVKISEKAVTVSVMYTAFEDQVLDKVNDEVY